MKYLRCLLILIILLFAAETSFAQMKVAKIAEFRPGSEAPFGKLNPKAPPETAQFSFMIGEFDCVSEQRNQDESWQEPAAMIWSSRYFLNGYGIQDYSWKENNSYSSSTRIYDTTNMEWVVTFYSAPKFSGTPATWKGGKKEDDMVLKRDQKAPNGMEGVSRLTFYDIGENGYKWIGEWVSEDGSIVYPFWKISCERIDE